jgi:hypothetical protein
MRERETSRSGERREREKTGRERKPEKEKIRVGAGRRGIRSVYGSMLLCKCFE